MLDNIFESRRSLALEYAKIIIEQIARREGISVQEVRTHMTEAILTGWNNQDPTIYAIWRQIPREGEIPSPEEFIVWSATRLGSNQDTQIS